MLDGVGSSPVLSFSLSVSFVVVVEVAATSLIALSLRLILLKVVLAEAGVSFARSPSFLASTWDRFSQHNVWFMI